MQNYSIVEGVFLLWRLETRKIIYYIKLNWAQLNIEHIKNIKEKKKKKKVKQSTLDILRDSS